MQTCASLTAVGPPDPLESLPISRSCKDTRRAILRCNLLLAAAAAFVLLTTLAMTLYPGSTCLRTRTSHYSFMLNFFSDLGATRTYSSRINVASAVLFMLALAIVGLAVWIFSFNAHVIWKQRERFVLPCRISIVLAAVCGLAYIGVAAFPSNLSSVMHMTSVLTAFGFLLGYLVVLSVIQIGNAWGRFYIVSNLCFAVVLIGYIVLLAAGPRVKSIANIGTQALSQKVVVYSSIANMAIQAFGLKRHVKAQAARDLAQARVPEG